MKIIRVSLSDPNPSRDVLRQFDYAAEELFGRLIKQSEPVAEIPDLDASLTQFHIHVSATRHLGDVTTMLKKMMKHHGVGDHIKIERLA
jgi:hypothetical protein